MYGGLFYISATKLGHITEGPMIEKIISVAEGKTLAYKSLGVEGISIAITKAILCNWMVTLGAFMAFTSSSTIGNFIGGFVFTGLALHFVNKKEITSAHIPLNPPASIKEKDL
ncbi:hypothetical protein IEC97_08075 [Neobacillus cucumis]|nr:hypothetical protein [Neobacillus cucumis]